MRTRGMLRLTRALKMTLAFVYYLFVTGTGKQFYSAYKLAQIKDGSFLSKCMVELLNCSLKHAFFGFQYIRENEGRNSISEEVRKEYGNADLRFYGNLQQLKMDRERDKFIIEDLAPILKKKKGFQVVEVGTAIGKTLDLVSNQFPDHYYIGVDLNVENAKRVFGSKAGVEFIDGYAVELMENGELAGDVIFFTSTACLFVPDELDRYIAACRDAGFKYVVFCEPVFYHEKLDATYGPKSLHSIMHAWMHNYPGYLEKNGFTVERCDKRSFRPGDPKNIYFWTTVGKV